LCFAELDCVADDFFDFFLAWCDFEDFFFLVLVVGLRPPVRQARSEPRSAASSEP
jgi:hypothetical protein